jgi:hypothetical protein
MDRSALGDVVHRRKRRILAYVRSSGCRKIEVVRRLQIKRRASASRLARINRRLGLPAFGCQGFARRARKRLVCKVCESNCIG